MGKLKEIKNIFIGSEYEIISLKEMGFNEDIEETGETFEENAFIKADTIYAKYKLPVIADDSGLSVEQLDGQPGVYSARYAGENVTYEDNNIKLLNELKNFKAPHFAEFICCAVYVDENQRISVFGKLQGEIISEFRGKNGFGFDPIFKPIGSELALAEMSLDEKNKISHRFQAFSQLRQRINI